jgi:hypothetical protein
MKRYRIKEGVYESGVIAKSNTITDPWPTRPKLKREEKGSKEELRVLLGSNLSGFEHYREWQKDK